MKKTILFISGLMVCACLKTKAQDPHFTQYFASPLTLNPANTGFFDGDYRVAINERQQWWNVGSSYSTTSVSADFKLLGDNISPYNTLALGFSGLFDSSLNGALQSNYIGVSGAYHLNLAGEGNQTLGVGFQATYSDRFLNYNRLTFASQFNIDSFDPSIPVNANFSNSDTKYLDVNMGILYAVHAENANIYAGFSAYHVNQPKETIFVPSGYTVPYRFSANAGAEVNVSPQSSVLFSGLYMAQAGIKDQMIGAAYALKTEQVFENLVPMKLYAGLWCRVNDSYIPYIGIELNGVSVGINYSIPTTPILGFEPHTIELSLIYKHKAHTSLCPHF